jgi:phosphoglycerol transferase
VKKDHLFVERIQSKLPRDAMVFQVPVMDFPEVPPLLGLSDYEHFRPYVHSSHLRFSYGSDKGRTRERWQKEAERLGPATLLSLLEQYGFSAVLVAKKGYADHGAALLAGLRAAGRNDVLSDSLEMTCVALEPSRVPTLPPNFSEDWTDLEGAPEHNWRWSSGDASIVLYHNGQTSRPIHVRFGLATIKPRQLQLSLDQQTLKAVFLQPDQPALIDLTITLAPGKNFLRFKTDVPGDLPGNGDQRKLAFNIINFTVD